MDDKEKILDENQIPIDDINADNGELEEKDGVKYETNDNWEFEAEAPTLNNEMLSEADALIQNDAPAESEDNLSEEAELNEEEQTPKKRKKLSKKVVVSILSALLAVVAAVFAVLYFTVPNGKEGKLMNYASVAATVDGQKVSLGMYNLYFTSVVSQYEQYANYGYYNIDTSADYATQYTTDEDGNEISWLDLFKKEALEQIKTYNAYYAAAKKEGLTLTESQQKVIDEQIENMKTTASEEGKSLNDYIAGVFGEYCTEDTVRLYMEQFYMSANYRGKFAINNSPSDDEINQYFNDNKSDYYQIKFSYLACEYDSSTDEAKAASDKKINDYMSQITDRQSIIDLVPTAYAQYIEQDIASKKQTNPDLSDDDARSQALENYINNVDGTINVAESPFSDDITKWLFDENQPTGTMKYHVNEETGYAYIILKTEQPTCDEDQTYTVRHILIMPETERENPEKDENGNVIYNDEEWAACKIKADEVYKQYTDGEQTEYSFALLAEAQSGDTASTSAGSGTSFGGLYEGTKAGEMVPEFENWSLDSSRKYGDSDIVKSQYGYHIMFYIAQRPSYQTKVISDIRDGKLEEMIESAQVKTRDSVIKKAENKFFEARKKAAETTTQAVQTQTAQ